MIMSLSAVVLVEYGNVLKKINMRSIGWTGWKIVLLQLFFARETFSVRYFSYVFLNTLRKYVMLIWR